MLPFCGLLGGHLQLKSAISILLGVEGGRLQLMLCGLYPRILRLPFSLCQGMTTLHSIASFSPSAVADDCGLFRQLIGGSTDVD